MFPKEIDKKLHAYMDGRLSRAEILLVLRKAGYSRGWCDGFLEDLDEHKVKRKH